MTELICPLCGEGLMSVNFFSTIHHDYSKEGDCDFRIWKWKGANERQFSFETIVADSPEEVIRRVKLRSFE